MDSLAKKIFEEELKELDNIAKKLISINTKLENGLNKPMTKFEKATKAVNRSALTLEKTFSKIFSIVKNIGFASLGATALSGGVLGVRGAYAQKSSIEAKTLGLDAQQKGALEYAGKQTMADSSFFKDILKSIRNASVNQESFDSFAMLGLDPLKMRKAPALEVLNDVLRSAKNFKGDMSLLGKALGELAGIDYNSFKAIDLDKFAKFYKEGLNYNDKSIDKLKNVGEAVNRVTANLQLLADKVLASLSPAFSKVLNNLTKGMNAIANNPAFKSMLDDFSKFLMSATGGFDEKVLEVIKSIPETLRNMQIVFLNILSALAEASTWILTGEADRKARKFAEATQKKADLLEIAKYKEDALRATTKDDFLNNIAQAGLLEKKHGILDTSESITQKNKGELKAKLESFQPQINITIQNDPTQAQMQKNFTQSITLGGLSVGNR